MPLTKTGKEVLRKMKKRYGPEKGESVFYATMKDENLEDEWEKNNSNSDYPGRGLEDIWGNPYEEWDDEPNWNEGIPNFSEKLKKALDSELNHKKKKYKW